jgi:chromosome segregation ATPase
MAKANGSGRIDDHEERLRKLEAARKEMEDTLVVMAHLEAKAAARIKEHAEFIADFEASLRSHDKRMAKQDERSVALDERVDKLVSSIGELISRIPPSALTR